MSWGHVGASRCHFPRDTRRAAWDEPQASYLGRGCFLGLVSDSGFHGWGRAGLAQTWVVAVAGGVHCFLISSTINTGKDGLWAPLSSGAWGLFAASCAVGAGVADMEPLCLTGLCGNLEKHTSLNLKLSAFNKRRGERKEKNADHAQSQINWDLTKENLRLYIYIYRFPQSIMESCWLRLPVWRVILKVFPHSFLSLLCR